MAASGKYDEALGFGPFKLVVGERLLTKNGVPVDLGGRAMDILITLASSPNEVISKKTLMTQSLARRRCRRGQPEIPYDRPSQSAR